MQNIKVGGMVLYNVPNQEAAIMKARAEFVQEYCHEKGWDYNELSITQVLEIREHESWKNPLQDVAARNPLPRLQPGDKLRQKSVIFKNTP